MSTYWDILTDARARIVTVTGLTTTRMTLRKDASWLGLRDTVPQGVIAPDPELAERVKNLSFEQTAQIEYDVYFLYVTRRDYDEALLEQRLEIRQAARMALFVPGLFGAFDVEYNERPPLDLSWLPDTLDATAQLFTYRVSQAYRT